MSTQRFPHAHAIAYEPVELYGRSSIERLRLDADMILRRLRRLTEASTDGPPPVEELDRIADAVEDLHDRIRRETSRGVDRSSVEDVVAARRSIQRSLVLVRGVADDVLDR